ncbi:hypothetical protein BDV26DRAFT_262400 [Aspergillus bertholletiae]|uniref:Isoamyl alcohol oxidase n=1 Tax=Aspergillus bertholletiae TaxID=1226010 RepID=A0A5N7B8H1_9EURO|nr:hypothetical protein BDV26DRAFT_262400 [Aspergillus bertholletiae]
MARTPWSPLGAAALQVLCFSFVSQGLAQSCAANYPPSVPVAGDTATLGPVPAPDLDTSDPVHLIPAAKASLYYGSLDPEPSKKGGSGSVNMNLELNHNTVVLEYIDAVDSVKCTDESVIVAFKNAAGFETAMQSWSLEENLILITNHLGNCDAEFERGFFKVDQIVSNQSNLLITCNASKQPITQIAETCELAFSSLPAGKLGKRLTLDPSFSIPFSKALANDTVLVSEPPYLTVIADQAAFSSEITFSGYLYYDFWAFKLRELYFDIDAGFSADVAVSAHLAAAYNKSFAYNPSDLTYTLVNIPGIVQLGPGVAFGLEMDISASTAVDVAAGMSIAMPDGNVHVDLLNSVNTVATGWTPTYHPYANISAQAHVQADASATVTVEMALSFLGGLVDLSSGLTAKPGIANTFLLDAKLDTAHAKNTTATGAILDTHIGDNSCGEGVSWKSDFTFSLDAFATRSWSTTLVETGIPLWDLCYQF